MASEALSHEEWLARVEEERLARLAQKADEEAHKKAESERREALAKEAFASWATKQTTRRRAAEVRLPPAFLPPSSFRLFPILPLSFVSPRPAPPPSPFLRLSALRATVATVAPLNVSELLSTPPRLDPTSFLPAPPPQSYKHSQYVEQLAPQRAQNEAQWREVAVALLVTDLQLGADSAAAAAAGSRSRRTSAASPIRGRSRSPGSRETEGRAESAAGRAAVEHESRSLLDEFLAWSRSHHVVDEVEISRATFDGFSRAFQEMIVFDEARGTHKLSGVQFMTSRGTTGSGQQAKPLGPDDKLKNQIFLRVCRQAWLESIPVARERVETEFSKELEVEKAKRARRRRAADGAEAEEGAGAAAGGGRSVTFADAGAEDLDAAVQERVRWRVMLALGVNQLHKWTLEDAAAATARTAAEKLEKRTMGHAAHESWVKLKERVRVWLPPTADVPVRPDGRPTLPKDVEKPQRFNFAMHSMSKRVVRARPSETAVDFARRAGISGRFVHAVGKDRALVDEVQRSRAKVLHEGAESIGVGLCVVRSFPCRSWRR